MALDFTAQDFFLIGFLVFLEGFLSVDNALVLAMLCRHLPPVQQKKALTYGLWGAVGFRLLALFFIVELIKLTWVKFLGGGYLLFIAVKEFLKKNDEDSVDLKPRSFWKTVFMVEVMDIAFAVDSILAAAALSQKLWVLFLGGVLGIIMMRFAATIFIKLLEKFPRFEVSAYLMVGLVGLKLVIEGFHFEGLEFTNPRNMAFWSFWGAMLLAIGYGFLKPAKET